MATRQSITEKVTHISAGETGHFERKTWISQSNMPIDYFVTFEWNFTEIIQTVSFPLI